MLVTTKYLGPTNTRGSRIKATSSAGNSVTIPYPYELSDIDVHAKALFALCEKYEQPTDGWIGQWNVGGTYVFMRGGIEVKPNV